MKARLRPRTRKTKLLNYRCAHCGASQSKPTGEVNRARKAGAPLFCNRTCAGLARRNPPRTVAEKRAAKRLYDMEYRKKNRATLKAKHATYHQRTYDPDAARILRKKRMSYHIEYCRKPEYRAKKHAYDVRRYHEKSFGPLATVSLLLRDLVANINERATDYENRSANQAVRNPQVRAAQEGKRSHRDRDRSA